jgi:hypothetical protein
MVSRARIGRLLRRLRVPGAVCGLVAACVFPLSAQSVSQIRPVPDAAPFPSRLAASLGQDSFPAGTITPHTLPATSQKRSELSEATRDPSEFKPAWERMVEFSGTPFTQQVRVPLGSLFGGRIRLGGFNAVTPMEHIQRGLPGGGSLDAWSPVPMGHAGMILPKDDNQYGLCLTFHLVRGAEEEPGAQKGGLVSRLADLNFWSRAY